MSGLLLQDKERVKQLRETCQRTLLQDVLPFWMNHSLDREFGGYFTCLNERGEVYGTDKFVWLQARQVWMFSKLVNLYKTRDSTVDSATIDSWREVAKLGAHFLRKHGMDQEGNSYFALTRQGTPLVVPYNIFSDCFAAMAFAQYSQAVSEDAEWALPLARRTFENIQKRKANPKGKWNKLVDGTRPMHSLSLPMIDVNLCLEMKEADSSLEVAQRIDDNLRLIFDIFLDKERGLIRENVPAASDPKQAAADRDTFEGRLVNPGHSMETLWFVMDVLRKRNKWSTATSSGSPLLSPADREMFERAAATMLKTLEFGWDRTYGGLYYFVDIDNKPPLQLEWDQKLWWVHLESTYALALAFHLTKDREVAAWFDRVNEYTWTRFCDSKEKGGEGEFWGYLNRQGEVLIRLKGGKWKGCFHVPRALQLLTDVLWEIEQSS